MPRSIRTIVFTFVFYAEGINKTSWEEIDVDLNGKLISCMYIQMEDIVLFKYT